MKTFYISYFVSSKKFIAVLLAQFKIIFPNKKHRFKQSYTINFFNLLSIKICIKMQTLKQIPLATSCMIMLIAKPESAKKY